MANTPPDQHPEAPQDLLSNRPTALQRAFAVRIRRRFVRGLWVRVAYWVIGLSILLSVGFWVYMYLSKMQGYYVYKTVWMNPTLPRMTVNDADLFVLPRGEASNPPVLVVHDGPGWDMHGMEALNALQDSFYVVYYDQRGTGQSRRLHPDVMTIKHHLNDLDSLSRHFGKKQPIRLVGQGWGALLIAQYLTDYNHSHVHSAVLISPPPLQPKSATYFDKIDHGFEGWWTELETHFIKKHIWIKGDSTAGKDFALQYVHQRHLPLTLEAPDSLVPLIRAGATMRAVVDTVLWDENGRYRYAIGSLAEIDSLPMLVVNDNREETIKAYLNANKLLFPRQTIFSRVGGREPALYVLNAYPEKTLQAIRSFWRELEGSSPDQPQSAPQ